MASMSRSSVLILLGLLVALTPFSGLPSVLRTLLLVILGFIVLGMGIAERARLAREARATQPTQAVPASPLEPPHGISPI